MSNDNPQSAEPTLDVSDAPADADGVAPPPAAELPPVVENPHGPAATSVRNLERSVLVENPHALAPVELAEGVDEPAPELGGVVDNPHAGRAVPVRDLSSSKLEGAPEPTPAPAPSEAAPLPGPVPQPVAKALPSRPRLRVSYWYEGAELKMETVLMTESRSLVHRETVTVPEGALRRVHWLLLSVAGHRAVQNGFAVMPAPLEPEGETPLDQVEPETPLEPEGETLVERLQLDQVEPETPLEPDEEKTQP